MTDAEWDRYVMGPILAAIPQPSLTSVAFHEAGHAVVARALRVPVEVVSIRPGDAHFGVALYGSAGAFGDFDLGPWWEHRATLSYVARNIAISLAGIAAEALVSPDSVQLAWNEQLDGRATVAAARLPAVERAALVATEAEVGWLDDSTIAWNMAEGLTGSVTEATAFLALMRISTRRLVDGWARDIAALARELLNTPVLDGSAVDRILAMEKT